MRGFLYDIFILHLITLLGPFLSTYRVIDFEVPRDSTIV